MYPAQKEKIKFNMERTILIAAFLFFPIILLILFSYYPLIKLIQLSFTDWDGISRSMNYIGLENFKDVFTDISVYKVFLNNVAYIIIVIIQGLVGMYLAIVLDGVIKARNFNKSIIFMPYIMNTIAIVFMFNFMYNYEASPINQILSCLGLGAVKFISNGYSTNFSLAFMGFWQYLGFNMVIFLAAIQTVPCELYEAAKTDGANWFRKVKYITIPSIKSTIIITLIIGINGAFQAYVQSLLLTPGGGPGGISETFVTKTLTIAMNYSNFGKASAMGVFLLAVILVFVGIQFLCMRKEG